MIKTKEELEFYLKADLMMNRGVFKLSLIEKIKSFLVRDNIMTYLIEMRKASYYNYISTNGGCFLYKIKAYFHKLKFRNLGIKLGFSLDYDVLGYGVVIPHWGTIVIGSGNMIGNYAVLHTSTCITAGKKKIGNNLYLSTGSKIISDITLGDSVMIGANALVNKDADSNCILLGVPATKKRSSDAWWSGQ